MTASSAAPVKKSGLKSLTPGEVLFNEGDKADSMFILQKGQLRLYITKGKGFVEIAVLRPGEVLGEMAYFDPDSKTRSVSAAAITPVEIIEVSFSILGKTMSGLTPWFQTVVKTLAERLKTTNNRVRALESNSVGYSSDYKFFQSADVVKILSVVFVTFKSLGEIKEGKRYINYNQIKTYALDIFNINEAKMEEFIQLLVDEKIIEVTMNEELGTKILSTREAETFRIFQVFFNTQRTLRDDKKLNISAKCEKFMIKVMEESESLTIENGQVDIDLSKLVAQFKEYNMGITLDDFQGAKNAKWCGEYRMGENNAISATINIVKMKEMFPIVRFMNALNRVNELKAKP